MGWNTSFPAEYLLQANSKDYKQTLAYSEELRQRQELLNPTDTSSGAGMSKSPAKNAAVKGGYFPRSTGFSNTTTTATTRGIAEVGSAQCEEERTLLKNTMLREGLLAKLYGLIKAATPPQSMLQPHLPPKEPVFDVAKGTEVLHLLLQLRDVGVLVVESIMRWHELRVRLAPMVPLAPFRFENHNYCIKMLSDLNFLSTIKTLGSVLGVNPSTMKQNPFMMPAPISERNFQGLREKPWRSLRLFDPPAPGPPSPTRSVYGSNSPSSSSLHKNEQQQKVTWQKRAEKQLELLSMPLESLSGPTGGEEEEFRRSDNNRCKLLRTRWSGEDFSASAADFEALGALDAPPHHMVTLVAASVLILLSPADQLPKDLSWRSCQKMLRHGKRLIQRVQVFDVTSVPGFKWKALVPFLQNEHFQPKFLSQFSCAASSMCAWVFSVLRVAQQQDYERLGLHTSSGLDSGGDEDRLELLSELEVDAAASPQPSKDREESEGLLPPLSRSRSGKRVSIGNAEVLFINENQPVMMTTPRASSRSSSRRSESPASSNRKNSFTVTSLHSAGESNALLRTSPWTYRGVVYFVSFFLQQEKERPQQQQEEEESADEAEQRRLMIKIYEPMSSVESQMSVDTEDLRQDFGEQALGAFQSGQYRTLCDLMLQQLDGMMGTGTKSAPPTPPQPRKDTSSTATEELPEAANKNESLLLEDESGKQANALDLLLQDSDGGYDDRRHERPEIVDEPTAEEPAPTSLDLEILEASAVRIQCAARQQQARGNVNRIRAQKKQAEAMEASALRIQCAARQNQARVKVDRARAEKTRVEDMEASALRIQCTARQKQARLKVDRVRAEKKQVESMEASALRIQCVARQKQARLKVDRVRVEKMQQQVDAVPETDVDEDDSEEAPTGEHGSKDADEVAVLPPESRPGTVMSYASDQFEDDARDSELDAEAD
ncbi:hypothetical protein PF005_g22108 [Phytophthora fragariae]|uniref:Dynein heavy chain coiled coil stalk domain-containing protein n=1 Tax=Phytophthora fragariae TaxID=53985 RepID=A0A6A3ER77_9STRA|nr:hypothetical protein PF009_g14037 [Phytophthora fragariae]KAE9081621.1 hypothetical protein PF010_g21918 [Phytophthora fragariae]KAE9106751.1 hypothetical protein PF006_g21291 [Phytophthora fragariae]KAE9183408.1 hypothetical protein PF005_g22108 [Phytophthora fragariae]KAE9212865.1 hypothetical protein PF004_g15513 [Phytophthora fragariae]